MTDPAYVCLTAEPPTVLRERDATVTSGDDRAAAFSLLRDRTWSVSSPYWRLR
jgi:hypothetical protein